MPRPIARRRAPHTAERLHCVHACAPRRRRSVRRRSSAWIRGSSCASVTNARSHAVMIRASARPRQRLDGRPHPAGRTLTGREVGNEVLAERRKTAAVPADQRNRDAPDPAQRIGDPHRHRHALDREQCLVGTHAGTRSAREHGSRQPERRHHDTSIRVAGCPSGRVGAGTGDIAPPRRPHRSPRPSRRDRGERAEKPRLVGAAQRTYPLPRQPLARKAVQSTVVADAIRGVPLDRVASEVAERGPGVEEARRRRGHGGDRRSSLVGGQLERGGEAPGVVAVRGRKHRGGKARGHVDRLVAHGAKRTEPGRIQPSERIAPTGAIDGSRSPVGCRP